MGRSIVILSLSREIERVVALAVIHLVRDDGKVLVRLAKWRDGRVKPDLQLPAVKCRANESSDQAGQRLLETVLSPLVDDIEVTHTEREIHFRIPRGWVFARATCAKC